MRRLLYPTLLALSACATGAGEVVRPDDVLPPPTMAALLGRAHVLEAQLQSRRLDARAAKDSFDVQFYRFARTQGVDTADFTKSYVWYANHVTEMDKLYEGVIDTLGIEESRVNGRADTGVGLKARHGEQTAPAPDSAGKKAILGGRGL